MSANKRINQLPEKTIPSGKMRFAILDETGDNITSGINLENIIPETSDTSSLTWNPSMEYMTDDLVLYFDQFWISLQDNNIANVPFENAFWHQVNKAQNGLTLWQPGVYTSPNTFVLREIDGFIQLIVLNTAAPFVSSDFNMELVSGKWLLASERGYIPLVKIAHGFAVDNILVYDALGFRLYASHEDKPIAIVKTVVDIDSVIIALIGDKINAFSGLIPGSAYYAQLGGTFGLTQTPNILFIAISETEAILVYGSASTPPAPGPGELGIILDDSFARMAAGSDYVQTTGDFTFDGSKIIVTGSFGGFGEYLLWKRYFGLQYWRQRILFKIGAITGTSYGIGMTAYSQVASFQTTVFAQFLTYSGGGELGKIKLYGPGEIGNILATSAGAVALAEDDECELILERNDLLITATFKNLTQAVEVSVSITTVISSAVAPYALNTSRFAINTYGANGELTNYKIESVSKTSVVLFIGDSITIGYAVNPKTNRYVDLLGIEYSLSAGPGDRTDHALLKLDEYADLTPTKVFVYLGVNDATTSRSTTDYGDDLTDIITALQVGMADVIILSPSPVNAVDVSAYVTKASDVATAKGCVFINLFVALKAAVGTGLNAAFDADGTHPNDAGHALIASLIEPEL